MSAPAHAAAPSARQSPDMMFAIAILAAVLAILAAFGAACLLFGRLCGWFTQRAIDRLRP